MDFFGIISENSTYAYSEDTFLDPQNPPAATSDEFSLWQDSIDSLLCPEEPINPLNPNRSPINPSFVRSHLYTPLPNFDDDEIPFTPIATADTYVQEVHSSPLAASQIISQQSSPLFELDEVSRLLQITRNLGFSDKSFKLIIPEHLGKLLQTESEDKLFSKVPADASKEVHDAKLIAKTVYGLLFFLHHHKEGTIGSDRILMLMTIYVNKVVPFLSEKTPSPLAPFFPLYQELIEYAISGIRSILESPQEYLLPPNTEEILNLSFALLQKKNALNLSPSSLVVPSPELQPSVGSKRIAHLLESINSLDFSGHFPNPWIPPRDAAQIIPSKIYQEILDSEKHASRPVRDAGEVAKWACNLLLFSHSNQEESTRSERIFGLVKLYVHAVKTLLSTTPPRRPKAHSNYVKLIGYAMSAIQDLKNNSLTHSIPANAWNPLNISLTLLEKRIPAKSRSLTSSTTTSSSSSSSFTASSVNHLEIAPPEKQIVVNSLISEQNFDEELSTLQQLKEKLGPYTPFDFASSIDPTKNVIPVHETVMIHVTENHALRSVQYAGNTVQQAYNLLNFFRHGQDISSPIGLQRISSLAISYIEAVAKLFSEETPPSSNPSHGLYQMTVRCAINGIKKLEKNHRTRQIPEKIWPSLNLSLSLLEKNLSRS